ncbi:hypothetical protein M5K25_006907 [Dendrobium thyrsiflorum]|uniref:Uncharacterized protein n=1 Tax=Dendrobium thyrsiflorum TaxID=117978 RepID=A0ABD0VCC9_DENTH
MDSSIDIPSLNMTKVDSSGLQEWKGLSISGQYVSKNYVVSAIFPIDNLFIFSKEDVSSASQNWGLALIGYSLVSKDLKDFKDFKVLDALQVSRVIDTLEVYSLGLNNDIPNLNSSIENFAFVSITVGILGSVFVSVSARVLANYSIVLVDPNLVSSSRNFILQMNLHNPFQVLQTIEMSSTKQVKDVSLKDLKKKDSLTEKVTYYITIKLPQTSGILSRAKNARKATYLCMEF